jgi:acetyl-CoA C-acetyltransferase
VKVSVLGISQTKFGELWNKSLSCLLAESQFTAIDDAKISVDQIDAIFTGNMCAGLFSNQNNIGALAAQILNFKGPSYSVEGACASGGLALYAGIEAIESGRAQIVLVNGVEKMTDFGSEETTKGLSAACHEHEQMQGATFPGMCAMIARLYMHTYGLTREELAMVSVQSHLNGFVNPNAHIRKKISVADVINAPMVADPLTLLDCSPISDGAASIILCSKKISPKKIFITGSAMATDTILLADRKDLLSWPSTQKAALTALTMASKKISDIDVVELHDGFSIVQLLALEDLGFCKKGTAFKEKQNVLINPSGGLKSRGHPVGATGIVQAVEIVKQLQKNSKVGLTHNVGGCGTTSVVHIFEREM